MVLLAFRLQLVSKPNLPLFGSCRRAAPPVLGAKSPCHAGGACAAGGAGPPNAAAALGTPGRPRSPPPARGFETSCSGPTVQSRLRVSGFPHYRLATVHWPLPAASCLLLLPVDAGP